MKSFINYEVPYIKNNLNNIDGKASVYPCSCSTVAQLPLVTTYLDPHGFCRLWSGSMTCTLWSLLSNYSAHYLPPDSQHKDHKVSYTLVTYLLAHICRFFKCLKPTKKDECLISLCLTFNVTNTLKTGLKHYILQ